jgi:hypothetical protein
VRLRVIPSAFAWEIASSGTWGSFWLRSSYYSWWLPPPRWLGAAQRLWQELVIVLDHLRWSCEGCCAFPGGAPKATLVDYSYHWATSLAVGSCGALGELGCRLPISRWTTRCRSTQRGLACRQAREPRGKILVFILRLNWLSPSDWSSIGYLLIGSLPQHGGIKIIYLSFIFLQTSCNKLFNVISFKSLSYHC